MHEDSEGLGTLPVLEWESLAGRGACECLLPLNSARATCVQIALLPCP